LLTQQSPPPGQPIAQEGHVPCAAVAHVSSHSVSQQYGSLEQTWMQQRKLSQLGLPLAAQQFPSPGQPPPQTAQVPPATVPHRESHTTSQQKGSVKQTSRQQARFSQPGVPLSEQQSPAAGHWASALRTPAANPTATSAVMRTVLHTPCSPRGSSYFAGSSTGAPELEPLRRADSSQRSCGTRTRRPILIDATSPAYVGRARTSTGCPPCRSAACPCRRRAGSGESGSTRRTRTARAPIPAPRPRSATREADRHREVPPRPRPTGETRTSRPL
jgi:hypothetical protein